MARRAENFTDSLGPWTPGYRNKWAGASDWCSELTRAQKGLYHQIIEQPGISRAGVISIGADVLAEQHPDCTPEEIEADLAVLVEKNYIVRDGSMMWVRSWFKYDRNICNPRYLTPLLDAARSISKASLRKRVATSLIETLTMIQSEGKVISPTLYGMATKFAKEVGVPHALLRKPS